MGTAPSRVAAGNEDGLSRRPWQSGFPDVVIHAPLEQRDGHPDYDGTVVAMTTLTETRDARKIALTRYS